MTMEQAATESVYPGPASVQEEGESTASFVARRLAELAEHPYFGFAITRRTLEEMGMDKDILGVIPVPPDNILLWLDMKTQNILAASLPKGMDVFGLLEKAKE